MLGMRWMRKTTYLDSIESEPGRANLVYDPFTPLDDVGAGLGVAVVNICSHCEVKSGTQSVRVIARTTIRRKKHTQIIIVLVLSIDILCPIFPLAVDTVYGGFAAVGVVVYTSEVVKVPFHVAVLQSRYPGRGIE